MRAQLSRLDQGVATAFPALFAPSSRAAPPAAKSRHLKQADEVIDAAKRAWDERWHPVQLQLRA
jgi:uncharacterized protein